MSTLDPKAIKRDLLVGIHECKIRGLYQSTKWLSEINFAIKDIKLEKNEIPILETDAGDEQEEYLLAKSYFDLKEYDRAAYFVNSTQQMLPKFLYYYSKYCSIEKKKLDNMTETTCPPDISKNSALHELSALLKLDYNQDKLDGYCLYLYGIVLKKLDLVQQAIDIFCESLKTTPLLWGTWQELAHLLTHPNQLDNINLPDHWMKQFFLAHANLELSNSYDALEIYANLHLQGFSKSTFILSQTALVHHNRREVEKAIETFQKLLAVDPFRLEHLDIYSNLLYVKEMKTELADLAHTVVTIDKYKVETCCVIGNYYSLRSDHPKAVLYFQRALKLNPYYLSAWTLMGHEYMEMKNTNAAIQSYRQAIEINSRDYRAWYGLGQTYEILKMPLYSLYYYKQSQQLRPHDSRMIIALGETYEKLDKIEYALKCYYKAYHIGDVEEIALIKLAKLYDKLNLEDNAAGAYMDYCLKQHDVKTDAREEVSEFYSAFLYLANYHLKRENIDDAYTCAFKCLEHDETKEHAKALLKSIAQKRSMQDLDSSTGTAMDETGPVNEDDGFFV